MVLSVVSNVTTLASAHRLDRTNDAMVGSLRRLSSGYRLTRAADDAAGLGISENLRAQIGGMKVAVRNAQDGISVLQIADGALGQIDDVLHRIRDLSVQAGNQGALNAQATATIQKEIDELKRQLNQTAANTNDLTTTQVDDPKDDDKNLTNEEVGFDPDEPPSFVGDELSEGGLGIAIIRAIADELEIESRPGVRGSRLRFAKRLR